MFVRRTLTRRTGGQDYHSHRLVHSERGDEPIRSASWTTLRRILGGRQRVTAMFKRADRRTVHVRKATRAEPKQQAILDALGITLSAGGTQKAIV